MRSYDLTICQPNGAVGLERTRFFPRQLIGPDDLTQDQIYFRDKLRRHNRFLHGWGVVCGAEVRLGQGDCEIVVAPGYILGPYGDEIMIDSEVTVDLCREGLDGNAVSPCGDALDPWCSDVRVNRQAGQRLYVAVKYAECHSRPQRVQANGCGCNEAECEYSRIRDSFAIKLLTSLPSGYSDPMPQPSVRGTINCPLNANGEPQARACPDCPPEPWVILADVVLGADGTIGAIDCFRHRRYVASFGNYYFLCERERVFGIRGDVLVDKVAEAAGVSSANVLVAAKRPDRSAVYIPAHFAVQSGETYASFLAREGGRELYDPVLKTSFTLGELYALSGVNPSTTIHGVAEAVTPLEGVTLRLNELRTTRAALAEALDASGTERLVEDFANAPAAADKLSASTLRGVSTRSALGRKLANLTVADVAATDRETFIASALEGVPARQKTAVENQAGEVWDNAKRVTGISRNWQ